MPHLGMLATLSFSRSRVVMRSKKTLTNFFKLHTSFLVIVLMCFWPRMVLHISYRWHGSRWPTWIWSPTDWQQISHFWSPLILHFDTWTDRELCSISGDMPPNFKKKNSKFFQTFVRSHCTHFPDSLQPPYFMPDTELQDFYEAVYEIFFVENCGTNGLWTPVINEGYKKMDVPDQRWRRAK